MRGCSAEADYEPDEAGVRTFAIGACDFRPSMNWGAAMPGHNPANASPGTTRLRRHRLPVGLPVAAAQRPLRQEQHQDERTSGDGCAGEEGVGERMRVAADHGRTLRWWQLGDAVDRLPATGAD